MKTAIKTDAILQDFLETLYADNISKVSSANYLSDINQFFSWFGRQINFSGVYVETFSDILPFFKKETGKTYKENLVQLKNPVSSVNRALSSLRRLSRFLLVRGLVSFDFMEATGNVKRHQKDGSLANNLLLSDFEKHLSLESSSKNTVKNYVSDVRHFLTWLERKS